MHKINVDNDDDDKFQIALQSIVLFWIKEYVCAIFNTYTDTTISFRTDENGYGKSEYYYYYNTTNGFFYYRSM